jgi:HD superfamily phosphodiesterase
MDFGCAAYCEHAAQCIGNLPPELLAQRENLLKDRVAVEMKRYFRQDFKRIGHASKVARYAEEIGKQEAPAGLAVILCAAYLHDIGIHEAERKHNSTAARYQEEEGPPIARAILEKINARPALIDEVCDIVGHHHHPRENETIHFKVLYDADLITNLEESQKEKEEGSDPERIENIIGKSMFTETGRQVARRVLLKK